MTGRCLCGAITYEITQSPIKQTVCHCDGCRRAGGAPAVGWVTVAKSAVRFAGDLKYITPAKPAKDSCDTAQSRRGFCAACGTHILFEDAARPDQVDITTGSLNDAAGFEPTEDVFAQQRLPWVPPFASRNAFVRAALKTQYHAVLATLKAAVESCPDELWTARGKGAPFWQVAYHALFFTHYYALTHHKALVRWDNEAVWGIEDLAHCPEQSLSKAQILDYWSRCESGVDGWVDVMDLESDACGFPWYELPKLDHQIVNIRHVQHHAAILSARLREANGTAIKWVGGTARK